MYDWEFRCDTGECVSVFEENGIVYVVDTAHPRRGAMKFTLEEWQQYIDFVRRVTP